MKFSTTIPFMKNIQFESALFILLTLLESLSTKKHTLTIT